MAHSHGHSHVSGHSHKHDAASIHPPQQLRWSILRMTLAHRLLVVFAFSAALWALVLLAVKQ